MRSLSTHALYTILELYIMYRGSNVQWSYIKSYLDGYTQKMMNCPSEVSMVSSIESQPVKALHTRAKEGRDFAEINSSDRIRIMTGADDVPWFNDAKSESS